MGFSWAMLVSGRVSVENPFDNETSRHPVGGGDQLQPQVLHRRPILQDQKHQCALADISGSILGAG